MRYIIANGIIGLVILIAFIQSVKEVIEERRKK